MPVVLLSRGWLWLTVPALAGGLALLVFAILLLLRTIRAPELARVSLSSTAALDLREAGPLSFFVDKPRFRNVQANALNPFGLSVTLEDATGRRIDATRALAPLAIDGVSRVRTEIASLDGAEPGRYIVHVTGLAADVGDIDSCLVVARPVSKAVLVLSILAIIAASVLTLGGLIASVATVVPFQSG